MNKPQTNIQTITKALQNILGECLGVDPATISAHANLLDDLGADSLDAVNIQREIKQHFNVELADEDFSKITTVADLAKLILQHL